MWLWCIWDLLQRELDRGSTLSSEVGPSSRDALEDSLSYSEPINRFSVGGTVFCSAIGWEGSVSQYYVIPGCWRALLGDTRDTLIETFLFGNSLPFPWLDNTKQMWSRPAEQRLALGTEGPSHTCNPGPARNLMSSLFPSLWTRTAIWAWPSCVVRMSVKQLGKFLSLWVNNCRILWKTYFRDRWNNKAELKCSDVIFASRINSCLPFLEICSFK